MLVDANLLIYATDETNPFHPAAADWLMGALSGDRRVALPWQTIGAFMRIVTSPRVLQRPLPPGIAWSRVQAWLDADPTWIPPATERSAAVLGGMLQRTGATGNLVPDAMLAALAVEHGLTVMTADTDFGRFPEVRWENPLLG